MPGHVDCRDAVSVEGVGHEPRVRDVDAEAQCFEVAVGVLAQLVHDAAHPHVVAGIDVAQGGSVVALSAHPAHAGQVGLVVDAEVCERAEPVLVDGVP